MKYITLAELKEIKAIKEVSGDMVLKISFVTQDMKLLDIAKYSADTLFKLEISPSEQFGK